MIQEEDEVWQNFGYSIFSLSEACVMKQDLGAQRGASGLTLGYQGYNRGWFVSGLHQYGGHSRWKPDLLWSMICQGWRPAGTKSLPTDPLISSLESILLIYFKKTNKQLLDPRVITEGPAGFRDRKKLLVFSAYPSGITFLGKLGFFAAGIFKSKSLLCKPEPKPRTWRS